MARLKIGNPSKGAVSAACQKQPQFFHRQKRRNVVQDTLRLFLRGHGAKASPHALLASAPAAAPLVQQEMRQEPVLGPGGRRLGASSDGGQPGTAPKMMGKMGKNGETYGKLGMMMGKMMGMGEVFIQLQRAKEASRAVLELCIFLFTGGAGSVVTVSFQSSAQKRRFSQEDN